MTISLPNVTDIIPHLLGVIWQCNMGTLWHRNIILVATHPRVSITKSHICFSSDCPGRRLSTWQMIAALCLIALGDLCGQLTFRLSLTVSRTFNSYGDRTFAAAGPRLWNSLAVQLRNPDITYRWQLNGDLFQEAWTWRSVTSDMQRLRKTLTYLLT